MATIPFCWSNDDVGVGLADKLREQVAFLDEIGVPGIFFVVPQSGDRTIDQDADLLKAIGEARANGHEFHQHGHIHTPYESGVPELWMLEFAPDVKAQFDSHRHEIEASHTLEAMTAMISRGRDIWIRAFGEPSRGYRPGWGAYCTNLYRALNVLGFDWVSARIPSPTSWKWSSGDWSAPQLDFRPEVPAAPHRIHGVLELPMAGDYAFKVPDEPERIAQMVELGMAELDYLHERGLPMVMVSHFHGLERFGGTGWRVHRELMPKLLDSGRIEPMTMNALYDRVA